MRALTFADIGRVEMADVPRPTIEEPGDVIVRVSTTAICGSDIGVYSEPEMAFPLNLAFVKGIDLKFCGTANIVGRWDDALALITSGAVDPAAIISHRLPLDDAVRGYELFASREAIKVVLTP